MGCDVLAFGAHPDDVELSVGGTVLSLRAQGYEVGIVDMTRGEMGTRGTPEIRAHECAEAATRLGVRIRRNLGLPDGHVTLDDQSKDAVIRVLREFRPSLVLAPLEDDLHPDHQWTGRIVREAAFLSGLMRWDTGQDPWRPRTVLGYVSHTLADPDIVVDISRYFDAKKTACLAYRSQFHDPGSEEPGTYIASEGFWDWWEARARSFGHRIGVTFGEGFVHDGPIPVHDPVRQFADFGYYREQPSGSQDPS
jgi:bacillithiol biosynthesis deacetylase BshB1